MNGIEQWEIDNVERELRKHVGKQNLICGSDMQHLIRSSSANNYPGVRACISHIRSEGRLPVCSNAKGYWVAATSEELDECIASLRHRISAQLSAIDGLEIWRGKI